jgi:hypothetical protein
VSARRFQWLNACEAWGFELQPPFTADVLRDRAPGEVRFRATRAAVIGGDHVTLSLTVVESWHEGPAPDADHRLEQEGCHVASLGWHVQTESGADARGAERLDIGIQDDEHPRIHRHPYGEPNDHRIPAELPPPDAWLHGVNVTLGGLLDDGLQDWSELADEED